MTTVTTIDRHASDPELIRARELKEAANADARDRWGDPLFHKEFAAVMTENIYWGFQAENVLALMTEVENVAEDDRIVIREVRGLRVFWVSLGGYIEQSTVRARSMELARDQVGFHVSESEDKMRANFVEATTDLETLATQMMDAAMQVRLVAMFQQAIPNTSPYYASGAGLSLAAVDTALTEVMEETFLDAPAIVGRATMVNQIYNQIQAAGLFTPETNEALLRNGVIGQYKGANIVRLRNFKNDADVPYFPNNELYVVGRDASKFGFWGGLTTKEWIEQGGWYWHLMGRRFAGGAVYRPERIRRIVDTSL